MASSLEQDFDDMTMDQRRLPVELLTEIFSHVAKGADLAAISRASKLFADVVQRLRFQQLRCQSEIHTSVFVSRVIREPSLGLLTRHVDLRTMPSVEDWRISRYGRGVFDQSASTLDHLQAYELRRAAAALSKFVVQRPAGSEICSLNRWSRAIIQGNPDAIMAFLLLNTPGLRSLTLSLDVLYGKQTQSFATSFVVEIFVALFEQASSTDTKILSFGFRQLMELSVSGQRFSLQDDGTHVAEKFSGREESLWKLFTLPTLKKLTISSFYIEDRVDEDGVVGSLPKRSSSITDLTLDEFECSSITLARLIEAPKGLRQLKIKMPRNENFVEQFDARELTKAIVAHRRSLTHLHFELGDVAFFEGSRGNLEGLYRSLLFCKRLQELTLLFPTPITSHDPFMLLDVLPPTLQVLHLTNPTGYVYKEHGTLVTKIIHNSTQYPSLVEISAKIHKPFQDVLFGIEWDPSKLKVNMYW